MSGGGGSASSEGASVQYKKEYLLITRFSLLTHTIIIFQLATQNGNPSDTLFWIAQIDKETRLYIIICTNICKYMYPKYQGLGNIVPATLPLS